MRCLVTGGAGFIGSALVDRLLTDGHDVVAFDNFSSGQREFLEGAVHQPRFRLVEGDLLDAPRLTGAMAGRDTVFHLAGQPGVRSFGDVFDLYLRRNVLASQRLFEAAARDGVRVVFSSSSSVYGEPELFPTPETCPFPTQTSLYGASKLAGEGQIAAYCVGFGFQGCVFRFVSILGERYTHGHVFDFYKKLLHDRRRIDVLGDGRQRKSYLYVQDCLDAMLLAMEKMRDGFHVFNLGVDGYCTVDESLGWICAHLGLAPERRYTGGTRGWVGDSPFIFLDTAKMRALGWRPKLGIREGVIRTLEYLQANPWVLERRA